MVLGLGCDTMATLTTRILPTRKERLLAMLLLALGVPCSAQLGVILAMMAVVPASAALVWFGAVAGVLLAVGWLAARVLPGERAAFVVELPPMRLPALANVLSKTAARVEWYLKEALPLFLVGTLLLWVMDRVGGIAALERVAAPVVVGLLQLPREAASAFILGFLRRDYAAAGLFIHYEPFVKAGTMTPSMEVEVVVALVTITLFIPCIANFLMIVKERGWRTGAAVAGFILPFSVAVGAVVNQLMRWTWL
jgi:ferrous iron transport protein B